MNEREHEEEQWEADLVKYDATPDLRIERVIQVRGRVTTVVVSARVGGQSYQGFGSAVCDQLDAPDPDTGLLLATGRAVEDLGHQVKKDGWRRVQRHPTEKVKSVGVTVPVKVTFEVVGATERQRGLVDWLRSGLARFK